jgi:two-component system sensor kinase FixL
MARFASMSAFVESAALRRPALRWLLPAVLAVVASGVSWLVSDGLRLEAGVAMAAVVLFGWRGFVSAFPAMVLVDVVMAPGLMVASSMALATGVGGFAAGQLLRRALANESVERRHSWQLLLAAGVGAAAGVIVSLPLPGSVADPLHLWLGMWAGALLSGPLLMESCTEHPDRRLVLALALALVAATLATAMPIYGAPSVALVASIGAVAIVPLVLAIGLADRQAMQLREAQSAGQAIFDTMMRFIPIGVFRVGLDSQLRYANPMFQTLTGLSNQSLRGWLDSVHDLDRERIAEAWAAFERNTTMFDQAFRVGASSTRWISVRIAPEYEHGVIIGYIGTISDITTQRLSEEARDRSDAQSRAVVDNAVDAIATIDINGIVLSFNRAATRMFGYAPEEVIGRNVSMLMAKEHGEHHDEYIARFLATAEPRIIGVGRELEAVRKDGSTVPIHLAVSEVVVDGDRTFTGIMRDISLERSDKEEIRRQNERLSVTVRNAPMGIVTYQFGETFASTNRAFETMMGYSNSELHTKDLTSLTHPDDRAELKRLTDEARNGRVEQFSVRLRLLKKTGEAVHVVIHSAITHDQHGNPDLIIAQVEDLTAEIQALEAERQHQDRLTHVARLSTLGEMTAGIAHEINQPLTAISMYAQSGVRMLDAGIPKPERLREALEKLSAQSLRAGAVIDRVQRLVRKQQSMFEEVRVNDLIGDILRLAESDARVNDTQISLHLADDLPTINADPIQIQQVLLNLIRNGIDAMRGIGCCHGSLLTITTRKLDGAVEVSVSDRGTGVGSELTDTIFTPFTTTKSNGMGIGLMMCRSIIDAHGGQLNYRNNPDHGATFYFQLPTEHSHEV